MITREIKADDFAEIAILAKQFKGYSKEQDIIETFSKILNSKDHMIIVCAESDNKLIGYIHGLKRLIIGNPISIEIGGIFIQQEYRRMGYGSLLLSKMEKWAKRNGINVVTLGSSVQNVNAHDFYNENGYIKFRDRFHFSKEI